MSLAIVIKSPFTSFMKQDAFYGKLIIFFKIEIWCYTSSTQQYRWIQKKKNICIEMNNFILLI